MRVWLCVCVCGVVAVVYGFSSVCFARSPKVFKVAVLFLLSPWYHEFVTLEMS